MGMGKAGVLSALAALEIIPPDQLTILDHHEAVLEFPKRLGKEVRVVQVDVTNFAKFYESLGHDAFDLVINTCNGPETEAAAILAARQGGRILFFNMATQFGRAVLTAEGMKKDVSLFMGNGYAKGHAPYALQLVRRHREVFP
jgi:L-erythro-3,5-diaminohexanoate dehydrogenase